NQQGGHYRPWRDKWKPPAEGGAVSIYDRDRAEHDQRQQHQAEQPYGEYASEYPDQPDIQQLRLKQQHPQREDPYPDQQESQLDSGPPPLQSCTLFIDGMAAVESAHQSHHPVGGEKQRHQHPE